MVEIFRTNVKNRQEASWILRRLHAQFPPYVANFDLDDCDRILRVKCLTEPIDSIRLGAFLISIGCQIEMIE